jgi:hypothetical protein
MVRGNRPRAICLMFLQIIQGTLQVNVDPGSYGGANAEKG